MHADIMAMDVGGNEICKQGFLLKKTYMGSDFIIDLRTRRIL